MNFTKLPLSLEKQADLLISRGMTGQRDLMIDRLRVVNYYRLSGYWFPCQNSDDSFRPGTSFEMVWDHYVFDRRLRLIVMDAVERLEVFVRTQVSYHHALAYGPFAYALDPQTLPNLLPEKYNDFLRRLREEASRSREQFLAAFIKKYGDLHSLPPVWMASEIMAFGTVVTFFTGLQTSIKQTIAAAWGVPDVIFESWLHTINSIRNICAHHGRLWNRKLPTQPLIPRENKYPQWHSPSPVDNRYIYAGLCLCKWALDRIAPQSAWSARLRALITVHPAISLSDMGFPHGWESSPIWSRT